ncbi:hypothetical protein HMPREF1015_02175 [Bacillus smithii 7_3_47FAA]|uniref:Uncharacterized protein n=1 Tax=Bacillus smithii 7_3_47FAA TaxID=665952 RepID=G9QJ14_9BACI|nr:hypothetical protein HMPREF1015_02175 [Bacillus smithii 7_3_47FAA]
MNDLCHSHLVVITNQKPNPPFSSRNQMKHTSYPALCITITLIGKISNDLKQKKETGTCPVSYVK